MSGNEAQFDYIVVGAGSAGAALAARLTEDANTRVLLLEAGKASHPYTRFPISFGLLIDNPAANWKLTDPSMSYNPRGRGLGLIGEAFRYAFGRGGFFSLPSAPLLAFLRTRPDMETPDVQMHLVPYAIKNRKKRLLHDFAGFAISVYQLRPESLGSIHIRSADPNAQPAIRFNFLHDPIDQAAMTEGFKWSAASSTPPRWTTFVARNTPPAPPFPPMPKSWTTSAAWRKPPTTPSAPAAWALARMPSSMTACASTASPAYASPTPRSSRPCPPATPTRRR